MIGQIAGNQRRLAAASTNFVIQLFKRSLRAGERHDMDALTREAQGHGASNAARCAGDKCDAF